MLSIPQKRRIKCIEPSSLVIYLLGRGEMEALSICKNRGCVCASMDNVALKYAQAEDVETLKLYSILRALWELGIQSKDEVRDIIKKLEVHDKTRIKDVDLIFE